MHVHNNTEDPRTEPGALWGLNLCLQGEAGSLDPVLKLMKPNIRLSDSTLKTFEPFCGLFYDALRAPENKEGFFFLVLSVCRTSGLPFVQVLRSWFSPAAFTWQVRRRRLRSVVHDELKAKPQPQLKHIREEYIRILCTTRTAERLDEKMLQGCMTLQKSWWLFSSAWSCLLPSTPDTESWLVLWTSFFKSC